MASQPPIAPAPGELQSRLSRQLQFAKEFKGHLPSQGDDDGGMLLPIWCVTGRRIFAFFLDIAVIAIIGRGLTLVAADHLRRLGEGGWWVAIAIAALYFALLDSSLTGGRTAGKRLMGIEVRRCDGAFLNPVHALVRFVPIGAMFAALFLWRLANPYRPLTWAFEGAAIFLSLGIGTFAIAHPRRQSLQDLLARTVVVRSGGGFQFEPAGSGEPALVFGTLVVLILLCVTPLRWAAIAIPMGQQMARLYQTLEQREGISSPRIEAVVAWSENWVPSLGIAVSAHADDPTVLADDRRSSALARSLMSALALSRALPPGAPRVTVKLRNGYDIGVWREMAVVTHKMPVGGMAAGSPQADTGAAGAPEGPSVIFKSTPGGSQARSLKEKAERLKGEAKDEKGSTAPPKPKSKMLKTPPR